jgi:large repetitive protein
MKTQSNPTPYGAARQSVRYLLLATIALLASFAVHADPLMVTVLGVAPNGATLTVPEYRWTVEQDATKLSVPGQPATQANYSFSFHTSYMPVVAAGRVGTAPSGLTQDPDVARLYAQQLPEVCTGAPEPNCMDPAKRYYLSVAVEGYQMGGAPITINGSSASATVYVNQYPVPTSQVSVFAFNDNSPINGAPDLPQEVGLEGFTVQLMEAGGTYGQSGGAVTQDGFGNPLGTTYNADGSVKVRGSGIIKTGPDGTAVIKNLFPAKYTVFMVPPPGSDWHQTSTIEGTKGSDAWVKNNEPSFFQEFGPPGHHVFMGFTKSGCIGGTQGGRCVGLTGGTAHAITGRIVNIHNSRTPNYAFEKGAPVNECWVGLNQTGGGTSALYATACKKDSTFTIPNVPAGRYELVVWDEPLDMIIGTQIIDVGGTDLALGDVPVFSWFGRFQGRVFQDIDGTGLPFFAEAFSKPYIKVDPVTGVETEEQKNYAAGDLKPAFGAGIASNIRFRDGSIYQSVVTKQDGTYAFTEVFPFFNWMVAEIDYARFKVTGATMVTDGGGAIDPTANAVKLWTAGKGSFGSSDPAYAYDPWIRLNPQLQGTCTADQVAANLDANGRIIDHTACFKEGDKFYRTEQGVTLLEGMQTFLGQTNHIEWGKQPYAGQLNGAKNENGGIAGIVHYAITRAEDDPRFAAAENWEPGVPRVQVNMFLDCDGDGLIDKPLNNGTGQCAADGLSSAGYVGKLPDVDNYPFCWRDPESCGLNAGAGQKGPEDRARSGDGVTFSFGDVFSWGKPDGLPTEQLHAGIGGTDSWDDNVPTDCAKPASGPVGNGSIPFAADLDCFDGLYNFNQLRPSLFDGGYAFGRVAGQAELPVFIGSAGKGTYVVEAVAPPGYLHVGSGDQNVAFGDELKVSTAALPFECVGMELPVPEFLTLFPGESNPSFKGPGQTWRKCDMKAVPLVPGTNPAPDFYLFTEAPVAGHGVGFILDDTATEFNRFSPSFGEKYAPPHLPVSVQDWTGREITRVYSDQFGSYNFLTPSSFTINPPYPSGVMPNMMVSCMNHPGPIPDPSGATNADGSPKMVIDPFFNRKYTQFCYTLQYLAGKTTYLDTPVLPIAAFASTDKNPLDCECQDGTPAIYSANNADAAINNGNNGPWVPAAGGTLTIVSAGQVEVVNPAYDPALPGSPRTVVRDYGFGATAGTVKLGNTTLPLLGSWSSDLVVVQVPANTPSGQLTITRGDNDKPTTVGLTVHVGGPAPIVVQPGQSIQAVIDAPTTPAGALISIPPGTYNEYVIADKRVRLQGWGANSAAINAAKASAGGLAAWRELLGKKIDARCAAADGVTPVLGSDPANCPATTPIDADTGRPTLVAGPARTFDLLPGQTLGTNPANNEPILFGAEEGPGILALGRMTVTGNGNNQTTTCLNAGVAFRIDGLTITGADSGGGVLASGYDCNLQITNNRVVGNYGTYGGGVRVGHTSLVNDTAYTSGVNSGVVVAHNWISQNGASEIASGDGGGGGVTMGTGSDGYRVSDNYVCGNFSMSDGGGISHVGLSGGSNQILNNKILLNQTFNQSADPTGGGLYIGGQIVLAGGTAEGTGDITVDRNLIQYNHAGAGAGGGVSIARTVNGNGNNADDVVLTNNMIVNNATAYAGGGVAVADVGSNVRLVNNTVADNASTATNRQSFPAGPKVQSTAQIAGIARVSGASPTLLNNIVFGNHAFTWSITPANPAPNQVQTTALSDTGIWDLGVVGNASHTALASDNSVLTDGAGNNTANGGILATTTTVAFVKPINFLAQTDPDQPVVLPESTVLQTALTFDEGGNFINVILSPLTPWDLTTGAAFGSVRGDYHIQAGSVAANAGTNRTGSNRVPTADHDGENRPSSNANRVDVGADEATAGGGTGGGTPALAFTGESGSGSFNTVLGVTTFGFGNVGNNTINTLTLTAGGTAPSVIGAVSVTGARFSITGNACSGQTLAVGATCTIQLRFDGGGGLFGFNPSIGNLTVDYNGTPAQLVLPISGS